MKTRSAAWVGTLLAGVTALGVISVPTSMAYLQDGSSAGAVTLTSGTADLTIGAGSGGAPAIAPGAVAQWNASQPATVTNTGSVPLRLGASVVTDGIPGSLGATLQFTVSVANDSCASGASALFSGPASPTSQSISTVMLSPGATQKLCVSYSLPLAAPSHLASSPPTNISIAVNGTQVTS